MRDARAAHAVVGTSNGIIALAGTGRGGKPVLEVERFDGQAWRRRRRFPARSLPAMPTPRNFARAVVFGDAVYIVGGSQSGGNSHASEGSAGRRALSPAMLIGVVQRSRSAGRR